MESRTFVVGDIHGAHIALEQCLERSGFRRDIDVLITLGDLCDGWPYVYECIEVLFTIKNRIDIIGNHDAWFSKWLQCGVHPDYWDQGGIGTVRSYLRAAGKDELEYDYKYGYSLEHGGQKRIFITPLEFVDIPPAHQTFFRGQHLYYKDDFDRLFVHAGFMREFSLVDNRRADASDFYWNRTLWKQALSADRSGGMLKFAEKFTEIFIGHTATTHWTTKEITTDAGIIIPKGQPITEPMYADIICNLDTGAGSKGKLTIMDVDSKDYWQSDLVTTIYGEHNPRG
jgi:serine/threonine protein phosphatase 1